MKRPLALAALALVLACAGAPPGAELDARRREALVRADLAVLGELLDDGLRYGHANGVLDTKAELLAQLGSGELRYRAIRVEASQAREVGGACVVSGLQSVEVTARGREIASRSVFTAVYAKQGGRWRLIAYQSAPAPPR